jgi:hypothetical protein
LGAGEGSANQVGRKRPAQVMELSSEDKESEDEVNKEIKQTMRVVSDGGKAAAKKPRVKVVVE